VLIISSTKSQSHLIYPIGLVLLLWICRPALFLFPCDFFLLVASIPDQQLIAWSLAQLQTSCGPSKLPSPVLPIWTSSPGCLSDYQHHICCYLSLFLHPKSSSATLLPALHPALTGTRALTLRFARSEGVWKLQTPNITNSLIDYNWRSINLSSCLLFLSNLFLLIPPLKSVTLFIIPSILSCAHIRIIQPIIWLKNIVIPVVILGFGALPCKRRPLLAVNGSYEWN